MGQFKVLIADGLEEEGQVILKKSADVVVQPTISGEELLKVAAEYDAIIVRGRTKVTPEVFNAATALKVVGRAGVGVDNIDLNAARDHHVTVVNSPVSTTIAVAELTFGLMLSLVREIPRADAGIKAGKWLKKEMEGTELFRKTLGVVGVGRIGSAVCHRAIAFGMRLLGYDPDRDPEELYLAGAEALSLDEVYRQADIITFHIPLTPETRGMVNAEAFARMKHGVYIICTARGNIIDEGALLAALESGQVAGAALDVFAIEPPGQTALASHPHVVATPHIGAQSHEAQKRAAVDIANEVLTALKNEPLRWRVA